VLLPDLLVVAFTTAAAHAFWRYVSYVGRQLDRTFRVEEIRAYLARPERPVALMDRRYWRDFQRELPPDLVALEKISIQGQELYIVRRSGAGG
jgi:hypothetical protein